MKGSAIAGDWEAIGSSVYGVTQPGATLVVFQDPHDPGRRCSREFFLDGLELEDLEWFHACESVTHEEVEWFARKEEEEPGTLRIWNETARAMKGL